MISRSFPGHFITPDKKRLFYCTNFNPLERPEGDSSPLLVFNYGLVCSNLHWSKQIPYFDQLGYRILFHNYRGHFSSSGHEDIESCTFRNLAHDLQGILQMLNAQSVVMIGHSMGVNVTLEYARLFPENLLGMVLISGTVIPPLPFMFHSNIMEFLFPNLKKLLEKHPKVHQKLWKTMGMNPLVQKMILHGGFNPKEVPIEFIQQYLNRMSQLNPQLFYQFLSQMENHDILPHLELLDPKALIICGDLDYVIPYHLQYILSSKLPQSEFFLVKGGSHVPQVDFPETINQRLNRFLEEVI